MYLMNAQVAVIRCRVVRDLTSDDLREFLQLTGIAVCLNAEVYDMASRSIFCLHLVGRARRARRVCHHRFRQRHPQREIPPVEAFNRAEVDRAVRAIDP